MKINGNLKIGGLTFTVTEEENLCRDFGAMGICFVNSLHIKIDKGVTQTNKETTLLHEILEAINSMYELELEHNKLQTLEASLYQVLKDNKILFDGKD